MTDATDSLTDSVSRRAVLRKSAATGALFVGGTAITGSATVHPTGGTAVTSAGEYQRRTPFEIVDQLDRLTFTANCRSFDSAPKEWDVYEIEYDDGTTSGMDVRKHKSVHIGNEYEFTTANPVDCEVPGFVQAAFKPVR